jgi:hypothetical protein
MTVDQIFIALLGIVCTGLGWFAREMWSAVQELKRDLAALRVRVGEEYVRYDRLQDALKPIHEVLARIENTLTHKADK